MFSLVIFTMMIFAILSNLGNAIEDDPDLVSGGFDIRAQIDSELPIGDVDDVIARSGGTLSASDFSVISSQAQLQVAVREDGAEDLAFKGAPFPRVERRSMPNHQNWRYRRIRAPANRQHRSIQSR